MKRALKTRLTLFVACALGAWSALPTEALALDQIIKPYESVRSSGMGGTVYTTGLYDDNFFANPARATANPTWRFSLVDVSAETNSHISNTESLINGGSNFYSKLGSDAGDNNHLRVETVMPALYIAPGAGEWAFAVGLITSSQADVDLRDSYNIDAPGIIDIGPALTVARTFLDDKSLSFGATMHAMYRLSTNPSFSFVDLIEGESISPRATGGQGAMLDFDLGATYTLEGFHPAGVNISAGVAVDNVLGGNFNNLSIDLLKDSNGNPSPSNKPITEPRRVGFGFSADKKWIGVMRDTSLALEFQDLGNNPNGSFYRTVHFGGETHLSILAARLGVNQGYFTGGIGIDLKVITIDVSTYGEELSLNPGGLEDRRYAAHVSLQL